MGKFKFKLKEERQTLKPKDVDPALLTRLEKQYGPINMEYDFFDKDLKTYFKTSSINPETGSVGHKIIKLASFADSLKKIYDAVDSLKALTGTPEGRGNKDVIDTLSKVKDAFNNYRSYLRKYYPDQYEVIKNELNEMSTIASNSGFTSGGEGENHTGPSPRKSTYGAYTQAGFKKVTEGPGATMGPGPKAGPTGVTKNKYVTDFKYTLVKNPLKEVENTEQFLDDTQINDPQRREFVKSRIMAFDALEDKLNQLVPMMQQAKNKTIDYYRNKPESFGIVYGTDLAQEYLDDLIELFKQ
jgi:hypothetical protein